MTDPMGSDYQDRLHSTEHVKPPTIYYGGLCGPTRKRSHQEARGPASSRPARCFRRTEKACYADHCKTEGGKTSGCFQRPPHGPCTGPEWGYTREAAIRPNKH